MSNDNTVNVMGNGDPVDKTPKDIRKTYPTPQVGKPQLSASQMVGDPEEFKRAGSTPAQGDNQTADDEVNDNASVDLTVTEDKGRKRGDQ